jgi:ATP-binding cassette, subfamily B, bacterial PglK
MREMAGLFLRYMRTFGIRDRLDLALLIGGGIILTLLELLGIAAIFPLLVLILDPASIESNPSIAALSHKIGIMMPLQMAMALGLSVCCVFILKGLFHIAYWKFEFRTLTRWRIDISRQFYDAYIRSGYEKVMQKNSADFISIISNVIPDSVNNFVFQFINLLIYALTALVLVGYLFFLNWVICAIVTIFGACVLFLHSRVHRKVSRQLGGRVRELQKSQLRILQQSFAGFKETKLYLKEEFFSQRYRGLARELAGAEQKLLFQQQIPYVTIELVLILLVMTIFGVLNLLENNMRLVGAQVGTMVLASFRLIPIINRSVVAMILINASREPVKSLFSEYDSVKDSFHSKKEQLEVTDIPDLSFAQSLKMTNISYTYPGSDKAEVLRNIHFTLKPGQSVGITGPSGSGKTTFIHILLGFLDNFSGNFEVDGRPINKDNIRGLHKIIGYVDQQIFVLDGSIAENVAFGEPPELIDQERVKEALRKAQLWDFVQQNELGMNAPVGENGRHLSGGQRQRLGIARAFYRNIKILILDEASAALDVETEYNLFELLESLRDEITVVMVAHRLSTLKYCDRIDFLDGGRISESGSFTELYQRDEKFRTYIDFSQVNVGNAV